MRILLSDLLSEDPLIDIAGRAKNGFEGVHKSKQLKPDVAITNMEMPEYDGCYFVKKMMTEMPLPIILLSSLKRYDPRISEALDAGAFAYVQKPDSAQIQKGYTSLKRLVHRASLIRYTQPEIPAWESSKKTRFDIIGIGVSTGGPKTIEYIINHLPPTLAIPVVIAQHMPQSFIESFSRRLQETSGRNIVVAQDGQPLQPAHIYLAPGIANIRIVERNSQPVFTYVPDVYREFNNPSIDCLFESMAAVFGKRTLAIVLTGMGKDGVYGLQKIKEQGGYTIAQDEASSVVYGMPKAAFESGAALYQMSVSEIPAFITRSVYRS